MAALKLYGAAANEVLPDLREPVTNRKNEKDFPEDCKKKTAAVEEAIQGIEAATDMLELLDWVFFQERLKRRLE